jgi:hypothetical protein
MVAVFLGATGFAAATVSGGGAPSAVKSDCCCVSEFGWVGRGGLGRIIIMRALSIDEPAAG